MKKLYLFLVLIGSSVHANDLSDAWRNFGKKSRIASACKALIVGVLTYESGRSAFKNGKAMVDIASNNEAWSKKWRDFTLTAVTCGSTAATSFTLGYYFLPEHLKHALAVQ